MSSINNKTLQELKNNQEFICPNCGSVNSIKDAFLVDILVKETSHTIYNGNYSKTHICSTFAKVRFCKDCRNVRLRNKIIRHVSYFTILPLVMMFIICLIFWTWKLAHPIKAYFFFMFILFFIYVPAVAFFREFISPKFNNPLLKKALEGNALEE